MGMAEMADAPVLLVGDVDRGGVFAQLLGTLLLLEEQERARVKGLIINRFRGDKSILQPGIRVLERNGRFSARRLIYRSIWEKRTKKTAAFDRIR